ncbi:MAG: hypothetical protein PHO09_12075 [Sphaerochaeta sp.]|nr:hypothetical protein [Sphaerochaeta sp.]
MKKTIAILLVLVIGMAGVFAATDAASLELKTSVSGFNKIILSATTPSTSTYEAFNLLAPLTTKTLVYTETEGVADALDVGHLNYMTNKGVGISLTIAATDFSSEDTETDISYTVKLGTNTAVVSQTPDVYASLAQSTPAITLAAVAEVLTIDSLPISVTINKSSYDNAAADTNYVANVYFTYSTT